MARQPMTPEQAVDAIAKYLGDLAAIENSVAKWRSAVFMAASMGTQTRVCIAQSEAFPRVEQDT